MPAISKIDSLNKLFLEYIKHMINDSITLHE